ncbi:MAG: hypothetical protein LBS35_00350 [Synergistaceae bacterium]|jgi:hypothetical protein|nr:hypothetical protein [Synergistaceae bacterium]
MIAIGIILALSVAALFIHKYWKNIVEWIQKAYKKIKEVFGIEVEGARTFLEKIREGFQSKAKYYNRNKLTKEWEERILIKKVDFSELPDEIKAKIRATEIGEEIQTTEELKLALSA